MMTRGRTGGHPRYQTHQLSGRRKRSSKSMGPILGEASSCSGRGNQDQVTTLMKRSFNSL